MNHFVKLREQFRKFFEEKGHAIVKSSSLVPDDRSVLITTAGMQQFKRYYTGELNPQSDFGSRRTVSVQKCFRTSDIEEVGDDTHLTFFEMLGNFSFGPVGSDDPQDKGETGYFKHAAIVWGWEFLTTVVGIDANRMYVTVFEGDKDTPKDSESYVVWEKIVGMPKERIFWGKREDNFWGPTGNEGPCGPTTEIYVAPSKKEALKGQGVEVWNIVFNQFYKKSDGSYELMDKAGIDTGMGYERLLAVIEGVRTVYETSAFMPLIAVIRETVPDITQKDLYTLADHIRAASFLIADGIEPSNKEAGYILRRLLRKIMAVRINNDIHPDIFAIGYETVKQMFANIYPEIARHEKILSVWRQEQEKFETSIAKGLREVERLNESSAVLSGVVAFDLYQSHGLPKELVLEFAKKVTPDFEKEFSEEEKKHQDVSRAGAEKKFGGHGLLLDTGELKAGTEVEIDKVIRMHTATHLLHKALRMVLGEQVHQMGSDINPERLRFDFNFERKLTAEEIGAIEAIVNDYIEKDLTVFCEEMEKDKALASGAVSFFKEKYPDIVKVYSIGSSQDDIISKELCGGPHVQQTSRIGVFHIIREESVGKGVRRIRAVIND